MEIAVDTTEFDAVAIDLRATQREADLALRSTISRSSTWLTTRVRRAMSAELRLPQKVLRRRMIRGRVVRRGAHLSIELWIGLNPVGLHEFGPRQNRRGVRTRRGQVDHAFIAEGRVFKRKGRARLPIEQESVDVADVGAPAIEAVGTDPEFYNFVLRTFERELLWRISRRRR